MTGISIIIVNYNVKYFLRQCLQSIFRSDYKGEVEVFVVDNSSTDGSSEMMAAEFPQVEYIYNSENVGFSKANNQAIKRAKHSYTLILNPDTILQEDTLQVCANYLDQYDKVGAIGVKMVDGSGTYLPESKRGFPTPLNSIFKLSGLSRLFSGSKFFNFYYQGHLSENEISPIEVLTGAFTFIRTSLLQSIGGFDEDYFMYGEDIELSFQIKEKGSEIHYVPTTQIIHFKGESTSKLSKSYLKNFYGAMGIYTKKRNKGSTWWSAILSFGIVVSAVMAILRKFGQAIMRPLLDWALLFGLTKVVQYLSAVYYHGDEAYYSSGEFDLIFLSLTLFAVICYAFLGQYDHRHNVKHLFYGFVFSSLGMLSVYSLLPSELRSSRLILLTISALGPFLFYLSRRLYNKLLFGTGKFDRVTAKRIAVVGENDSVHKIEQIIAQLSGPEAYVGSMGIAQQGSLGSMKNLQEIVDSRSLNEIVFCSADLSTKEIFSTMASLGNRVSYKLANNDNTSILGSDSKERVGEWYTLDLYYKITQPFHVRTKRLIDLGFSFIVLFLFPLVLIFSPNRSLIFSNVINVIAGKKTWLGYISSDKELSNLPLLNPGVFELKPVGFGEAVVHETNLHYAKNYSTWSELTGLFSHVFSRK